MCKKITFLLILSFGIKAHGQEETVYNHEDLELFQFDYILYPIGKDDVDFSKTNLKINIPSTIGEFTMKNSLGIKYYQFSYGSFYNFDISNLQTFYDLSYELSFGYSISKQWIIGASVETSLSSNTRGKITSNDLFFNGGISAMYKFGVSNETPIFKFGVGYYTFLGKPKWLPVILYFQTINDNLSIGIGFPISRVNYELDERNTFDVSLEWSGLYAHLSTPKYIDQMVSASKVQFNEISLEFKYNYKLDPNWSFYFGAGYQIKNDYLMLDNNNNRVYDFQTIPKPYFSSGIKFNLKNN